jgi:hypothetical protein
MERLDSNAVNDAASSCHISLVVESVLAVA